MTQRNRTPIDGSSSATILNSTAKPPTSSVSICARRSTPPCLDEKTAIQALDRLDSRLTAFTGTCRTPRVRVTTATARCPYIQHSIPPPVVSTAKPLPAIAAVLPPGSHFILHDEIDRPQKGYKPASGGRGGIRGRARPIITRV